MYPYTLAPKPLSHATFYILLALARHRQHGYGLIGSIHKDSLGALNLKPGFLYPLLTKLFDEGLVEITGTQAAGPSLKTRMHYGITHEGLLRLKTELKRFEYVAAIGKTIPLPGDELSVELQRVLHNLKIGANRP